MSLWEPTRSFCAFKLRYLPVSRTCPQFLKKEKKKKVTLPECLPLFLEGVGQPVGAMTEHFAGCWQMCCSQGRRSPSSSGWLRARVNSMDV